MGSAHNVWATLGLLPLTECVLSWSTPLRLQVALQGNYLKRALDCVHFPGLSCSGSDSRVLHKAQTRLGLRFVPFPGPSSSGNQVLGERALPRWGGACYHLPGPSHLVSCVRSGSAISGVPCLLWGADLWLRPSWWMSTVHDPRKTWLATGGLLTVWWRMPSLGQRLPLSLQLWLLPACLSASGRGWASPQPASTPLVFAQSFVL